MQSSTTYCTSPPTATITSTAVSMSFHVGSAIYSSEPRLLQTLLRRQSVLSRPRCCHRRGNAEVWHDFSSTKGTFHDYRHTSNTSVTDGQIIRAADYERVEHAYVSPLNEKGISTATPLAILSRLLLSVLYLFLNMSDIKDWRSLSDPTPEWTR